jgi:hypothetical protein
MYKSIYFSLKRTLFTGQIYIRNQELPICKNCVHFIEHTNNYPYDPIPCDKQYGKCKKFGEMNMITGAIEYDIATDCRLNVNKCGIFASEYSEKIKIKT